MSTTSEHPLVFLLEDSFVAGAQIERTILARIPECRLLWARSIEEAHVRTFGLRISLFLLDEELPDGKGIDFLLELRQAQPAARAIVLSAGEIPETRQHLPSLGVLRFLRKPVESKALTALVRDALFGGPRGSTAFRANLRDLSPLDVLQLKCLSGATTMLEFSSNAERGLVHLERGEVIHAEAAGLSGVAAVCRIIGWTGGQIAEKPPGSAVHRTIDCHWQSLLMQAAQTIDEG